MKEITLGILSGIRKINLHSIDYLLDNDVLPYYEAFWVMNEIEWNKQSKQIQICSRKTGFLSDVDSVVAVLHGDVIDLVDE